MSGWDGKTKGSLVGYKIFVFFIKTFGLSSSYLLLRFVAYYYFLFEKEKRKVMVNFYSTALNKTSTEASQLTLRNFNALGQTLIDGVAFLVGKASCITHTFNGEEHLINIKNGKKGGILLSAHLGNWETAGNLLSERITSKINVVMLDAEIEKIKRFLEASTGGSHFNSIPVKEDMSHVFQINNALKNNEFVTIHADRFLEGAKYLELNFLGKKAKFPLGPFILASKFDVPVSFVFALKKGKYHYELSASEPIVERLDPEEFAKEYIKVLEEKVKSNPEQWFNYFEFYQS